MSTPLPSHSSTTAEKLKWLNENTLDLRPFLATKPSTTTTTTTPDLESTLEGLSVTEETREEKIEGIQRDFTYIGGIEVLVGRRRRRQGKEDK